jgi:hypothetical protein
MGSSMLRLLANPVVWYVFTVLLHGFGWWRGYRAGVADERESWALKFSPSVKIGPREGVRRLRSIK